MHMLDWPVLLWLHIKRLFVRWTLWETEAYLAACARDGLTDSLSLREFRGQCSSMRVQLALLDARIAARRALRRHATHSQRTEAA